MNEVPEVFPAYRLVAEFADGQRLTFDGLTEQQAQDRMEAAQAQHGDICWYDGVTDQHYENGKYYKLTPQPPEIIVIDPRSYLRKESLPELVAEYDIDMALFLYHQNNLSEELIDFLNRGE